MGVPLRALAGGMVCLACATRAVRVEEVVIPSVCPRPQVEQKGTGRVPLGPGKVSFICRGFERDQCVPVNEGLSLLRKRLRALGVIAAGTGAGGAVIIVEECSAESLTERLGALGSAVDLDSRRRSQAYYLKAETTGSESGVHLMACTDRGLYYGLVSLCQLVTRSSPRGAWVPAVTIGDWPEIGNRLCKTSASDNPVPVVTHLADWLPLMKIDLLGMQYHGQQSRHPDANFLENTRTVCRRERRRGILETVVYFCPFRGGKECGFDLLRQEDRDEYVQLLRRFLAQGAHGIEIDYNDWSPKGPGMSIEDTIDLVCRSLPQRDAEPYVLYCPPIHQYQGPVTPELAATLSRVPRRVRTLWTGTSVLITRQLTGAEVEEWTRKAGRRPFLWVNRVSADAQFSQPLATDPDARVFRGEWLPRELNALFEGVHFNGGLPGKPATFERRGLAYLATAADYVWNPGKWEATASWRRASHLVDVMLPLLPEAPRSGPA